MGSFNHIIEADPALEPANTQVSYSDKRLEAIKSFGSAKKRRLKEGEKARQVSASQVENAMDEGTLKRMRQKADQHASANASQKDEELALLAAVLPPFSLEAKAPGEIYQ